MTEGILAAVSLLLWAATLLQLWPNPAWQIRDLDFPRLQLAAALLVLLSAQILLLAWASLWEAALFGVTLLCLMYQLWWILPYSPLWPKEVGWAEPEASGPRIGILAANVLMPNRQIERLLQHIQTYSPDVLVLLETDDWWDRQLRQQLSTRYPHQIRCPKDNLYGMHVFSRLRLADTELRYLVEDDIPSMHASVAVTDDLNIRMHFLHPAPPSPTENDESTERDAELLVIARSVRDDDGPVIVAGDLNDVAWSPTTRLFRKISNLLDPRVGRGMFNTFHAQHRLVRWPLDHFFHSDHFKVAQIKRLAEFGSDHFPIFIELVYDEAYRADQHSLAADEADRESAREKTAEGEVRPEEVPEPRNGD